MNLNDNIYLKVASLISKNSFCLRRKVGAVIVKDDNICFGACNGSTSVCQKCVRKENNIKSGTLHEICNGVHAERRLLEFTISHSIETTGAIIYCTHSPCRECATALIDAKIAKFIYLYEYPDVAFKSIFKKYGIIYRQIGSEENDN